jgi:hypothetical protein
MYGVALTALFATSSRCEIILLGVATMPGDATDLSGLKEKMADGTPQNRLGGLGSAIAYSGQGNEYVLASDRGPKDGNSDYICRFHRMDITVKPGAAKPVSLKLTATTLLTNEKGRRYVGSLDAFHPKVPALSARLDPEGVRVGREGAIYISDEYGPVIYEFDAKGTRRRSFPVPAHFHATPGKTPADELPPKNTVGRQPNRGMEGLAITPDGTKLIGCMQSPLIQDGALGKDNARVGLNCRILVVEIASGKTREFVYPLDAASNGVSEILAVNDHEFLVLERDSLGGVETKCKKVFLIDLTGATDVSNVTALPAGKIPATIEPVKKKLFLDLLAKEHKIVGKDCPEKFEGLAFGPDLPDGRHLLIVTADNDFIAEKPLHIYAFAIDKSDLPGFRTQEFAPKR